MYWLNPSSMNGYQVSLVPSVIGHHSWPVSWSEAPAADMMNIGYSIPFSGPSTMVSAGKEYGIQRPE